MELCLLAVPVGDAQDTRGLFALLRDMHVHMDPCSGDPRFETDSTGQRRVRLVATPRVQERLREAGRTFERVRDFADTPDPRVYVSRRNRFADELARLRAMKPGR
jgi:hypothetical protein